MKSLPIHSEAFNAILVGFEADLKARNKCVTAIYSLPICLREFFHYLESKGYENLIGVTTTIVTAYYQYLSTRKNQRRGGALSNGSLNKHQYALRMLLNYLKDTGARFSFGVHLRNEKPNTIDVKQILTQEQIKELFDACDYSHLSEAIRLRDKAILVMLYSCGLRRGEAEAINLADVDFNKRRILITKGSGNKKRTTPYVAINDYNLEILQDYLNYSRPQFYRSSQTDAFFVNKNGKRLDGQTFMSRVKTIVKATENNAIIEKHITPHSLRHSIATHLLQNGLSIKKVGDFLGHKSIDATQIYTQIAEQLNA